MSPYEFTAKPSKIVKPATKCNICQKPFMNARALVQHNQQFHQFAPPKGL